MATRKPTELKLAKPLTARNRSPRRKRLLINPQFQAIFAAYSVITTILIVPLFIAINVYFFGLLSAKAKVVGLPADHELLQFVDRQQTLMNAMFIAATLVAIAMNLFFSYVFSNRIAGSLYRLTASMNQASELATAAKLNSRRFDFFQDVHEAYNQFLDRMRT